MRNYWTCTKFADWIRGTPKLRVGTSAQWKEWRLTAEQAHPTRYWIAEEGLSMLQDVVYYIPEKIRDLEWYLQNRFVDKPHALTAHPRDIKPGEYADLSTRLLHCSFNELVNFVECEKAWMYAISYPKALDAMGISSYETISLYRTFNEFRHPLAGIAYLNAEADLVYDESWGVELGDAKYGMPTDQALNAKWVLAAYEWWSETRPARPDPYDASGWLACSAETTDLTPYQKECLNKVTEIEMQYEAEDTKWLVELMQNRKSMWT